MKIIDTNKIAINFYGYSRDEMLKLSVYDLRSPDTKYDIEYRLNIIQLGNPLIFETKHLKKDGTIVMVEIYSEPQKLDKNLRWKNLKFI